MSRLLRMTPSGLYCEHGGFFIDPSRAVERAVITHAHGDHARRGTRQCFCAKSGEGLLRVRLQRSADIRGVAYGEAFRLGAVTVSLHPAGHILGSAQVRIERNGEVWVVSGDYKRQPDPSCEPFEVVPCEVFITEATYAEPGLCFESAPTVGRRIMEWWDGNRRRGRVSILYCYALGKAQRILAELAALTDRVVVVHADIAPLVRCYREVGVRMLPTRVLPRKVGKLSFAGELILAPVRLRDNAWLARFGDVQTAFASGWMGRDGAAAELGYDRGFVLSDHADWPDLLKTIAETGAKTILATHGSSEHLIRHLRSDAVEVHEMREYLAPGESASELDGS